MKTIDEAAKDYLKNVIGCVSEHAGKCAMHDFTEGVLFAQKWIPVEEEMPENVKELIGNNIKSENVLIERTWNDNGEIAIEVNCRFRPSERIGFLWNVDYKGSTIKRWRPIERH